MSESKLIGYNEEDAIKRLLIGRSIASVTDDTLILDNGTKVRVLPNEGCGGCGSGWYDIAFLDKCEAVITNVRLDVEGDFDDEAKYRIFVLAAEKERLIAEISGSDGNGYYGSGYELSVEVPE